MKLFYSVKARLLLTFLLPAFLTATAQSPTLTTPGICEGVIANFNTSDNGVNSPSVYGGALDSSFYYHGGRGYWTDYLPPFRTVAPGFPRVQSLISPPYVNPNPSGTFNVGFYYIVPNAVTDQFVVRIISVTQTPMGTVTNVEASSGVQSFATWSTPTPYNDLTAAVPDPTPFMGVMQGNVCIRLVDPDIVNSPNTTFRVEVYYIINSGAQFAVFDNLSIGPLLSPLPVNFIGLVANRGMGSDVNLKWDVSDEVNVQHYEIERSENGFTFTSIGTVSANAKAIYSFNDRNAPSGNLFYRVRNVDIDGASRYSGVVRLKGNGANSAGDKLIVYPSPATEQVMVEHERVLRNAQIIISGMDGRIVRTIRPTEGSTHTPVIVTDLMPGVYIVRFEDGNGLVQTTKMIKK
jgi:hypothetical protein